MDIDKNSILYNTRGCCCKQNELGELQACASKSCQKLQVTNWLENIPPDTDYDTFEVRFKNTRKGYFKNVNNLNLRIGDIVAVEASPGHDTGVITLSGPLVDLQIKRHGIDTSRYEFRRIYRKAKPVDIEKWQEAVSLEHSTMIRTRQIVNRLGLNMKIGDVEYQGDKTKAIFYYIADERIDFRTLIKVLAEEFKIRVEMRQIGARQEAGLIGGIGPCGRELCCAQWMCNFVSVTTGAARYQDISLNPQKLAGQCSKLKCCLNFELDTYIDAYKHIPRLNGPLDTENGPAYLIKTDILKGLMWFSHDKDSSANMYILPVDKVRELVKLNKQNVRIKDLESISQQEEKSMPEFKSAVGEDSITRFDDTKRKKKRKPRSNATNTNSRSNGDNNKAEAAKPKADNGNSQNRNQQPKKNDQQGENSRRRNSNRRFSGKKHGEKDKKNSNDAK